jgi:hypothetical protein
LVLLLKLLLVEYLDREDAVFVDLPGQIISKVCRPIEPTWAYRSNISFQYGFRVFLMTDVVWVCSPPTVATAKGSGKPAP